MSPEELKRYEKQIILEEVGVEGQKRLKNGCVLVVGAGGLGCPALLQLATAGVGTIGIVDGDQVEISNLPRQPLYNDADLHCNKALVAARKLSQINPHISLTPYPYYLNEKNIDEITQAYDIIIDGSDQPSSRYLISDWSIQRGMAHIYGAVEGMQGHVAVFNIANSQNETCSYRDLFQEPPPSLSSCKEAGIIGMVPHCIGTFQALEAMKLILGLKSPLHSHLLVTDFKTYIERLIALPFSAISHVAYRLKPASQNPLSISPKELCHLLSSSTPPLLIDIRNALFKQILSLPADRLIVLHCKTGKKSREVASKLKQLLPEKDIRYLTPSQTKTFSFF